MFRFIENFLLLFGRCFYPQLLDKFFKKTEISISFVRPPYPDNLGISAGQIRESLLKFTGRTSARSYRTVHSGGSDTTMLNYVMELVQKIFFLKF